MLVSHSFEASGFAGGGGGGGGGEGFGDGGCGGDGRRKEAEEATGLKGLGIGEEAVGRERNCIRMVVSDFRMRPPFLLGRGPGGRWRMEDKARRRDFSSCPWLVWDESALKSEQGCISFRAGRLTRPLDPTNSPFFSSNKQPILKFAALYFHDASFSTIMTWTKFLIKKSKTIWTANFIQSVKQTTNLKNVET